MTKNFHGFKLNARQQRFCEEYLVDLNATAAYRRAGYKAKTDSAARASACEILANPNVQAYISEARVQQQEQTGITATRILEEYAKIAFANITDVMEFDSGGASLKDSKTLPQSVSAAIESVTVTTTSTEGSLTVKQSIKMHSKLNALDALAHHVGLKNDLNWAWKVLKHYGFERIETEQGYELIDTYRDADTGSP